MQLQPVHSVLELVLRPDRQMRQLARLAGEHEPRVELQRKRRAEQEATRLGGEHAVGAQRSGEPREAVDRALQSRRARQQRGDVLEQDARLGEVGHVADDPRDRLGQGGHLSSS